MSLSSIPYFNFDIPVVSDLRGRFVYHYFTPGETIYPGDDDATLEDKTGAAFGFPRKIVLELKESLDDIADSDVIVDPRIVQERIINASNVSKAVTEGQAQSRNASRLSFNIDADFIENIYQNPDFDSCNDHFDMAIRLLNNVDADSQEILNRVLENTNIPGPIEFEPSTNLPVVEFDEKRSAIQTSSVIMDSSLGDLISSITNDRFSSFADNFAEFQQKSMERQSDARKSQKQGVVKLSDYLLKLEPLDDTFINERAEVSVAPIGFIFYKTRIEGDERIPENPLVLINRKRKTIIDPAVIYGATYEYSVHTLVMLETRTRSGNRRGRFEVNNFLLISKDATKINIECEERKPPPPPNDVNFTFLDSSMLVNWQLPIETDEKNIPVNDIKYVQIFRRSSLEEPFSLVRMFDFNDALQVVPLEEFIPPERIKLTTQNDNSLEVDLPDRGEYFIYSVCCVDAHGNSSFLGPQFGVSLNPLGQPVINHVAYPGSPKQYPNMTVLQDAFEDSIRASGYKSLTIHHNPNFTVLLNGKNRQKLVSVDKETPSYLLQLIDVETQKDEIIQIIMRQN